MLCWLDNSYWKLVMNKWSYSLAGADKKKLGFQEQGKMKRRGSSLLVFLINSPDLTDGKMRLSI